MPRGDCRIKVLGLCGFVAKKAPKGLFSSLAGMNAVIVPKSPKAVVELRDALGDLRPAVVRLVQHPVAARDVRADPYAGKAGRGKVIREDLNGKSRSPCYLSDGRPKQD